MRIPRSRLRTEEGPRDPREEPSVPRADNEASQFETLSRFARERPVRVYRTNITSLLRLRGKAEEKVPRVGGGRKRRKKKKLRVGIGGNTAEKALTTVQRSNYAFRTKHSEKPTRL